MKAQEKKKMEEWNKGSKANVKKMNTKQVQALSNRMAAYKSFLMSKRKDISEQPD